MLGKRNLKGHLDEMQIEIRNKLGNQCFFILFSLLILDLGLKDYGVKWAASPLSIYAIIVLCMGYYLIRIVWAGAYASTLTKRGNSVLLMLGLLAALTAILSVLGTIRTRFLIGSFNIPFGGFLRLFIFSLVFIVIIFVSSAISRHKNNKGND